MEELGIRIEGETENVFLCLCPFHPNFHSPAFCISKDKGLYYCQNGQCSARGNLRQLIQRVRGIDGYAANRLLRKHETSINYVKEIERRIEEFEFTEYQEHDLMQLRSAFPGSPAHVYMRGRGFVDDTLRFFDVGYSRHQPADMVIVPVHDPGGIPIGFVGRSITQKRFQNSDNLPKNRTLFNYHRAKATGGTVIIVESSFDAMRVHQAGYPNVVATLGGSLSKYHVSQLARTFDKIINFQDWDKAGRALGHYVEEKLPHKEILWAGIEGIYPRRVKDASDLTDDEIRQSLRHALPRHRYAIQVDESEVLPTIGQHAIIET